MSVAIPIRVALAASWLALACWTGLVLWRDRPLPRFGAYRDSLAGKSPAAREVGLRDYVSRSPHDGDAREELARLLGGRGDYAGAASELGAVPEWWPGQSDARFREGEAWMLAGCAAKAERAWRRQLASARHEAVDPGLRARARVGLLNLLASEDRWEEFRALVWAGYPEANPPTRHELRVMALRAQLERSDPSESLPDMRAYVRSDPDDLDARRALARFAAATGLVAESEAEFADCLRRRPDDPSTWREWLAALEARGDRVAFARAVDSVPAGAAGDPDVLRFVGIEAVRRGDVARAEAAFDSALRAREADPETHYRLGLLLRARGQTDAARAHFDRNGALREARADLASALRAYDRAVLEGGGSGAFPRPAVGPARRLAALCATLGLGPECKSIVDAIPRDLDEESPDAPAP